MKYIILSRNTQKNPIFVNMDTVQYIEPRYEYVEVPPSGGYAPTKKIIGSYLYLVGSVEDFTLIVNETPEQILDLLK